MSYKSKWKLKMFWYQAFSVIVLLFILLLGWLQNKLLEMLTSIVCFYLFRPMFDKQSHAKTVYKCNLVSIIVFLIMSRLTLSVNASVLCTILLTFSLNVGSYYLRVLLDNTVLLETYKRKLEQFEHKCLENLTELELQARLPEIPYEIIHIVYGYLHKPKTLTASGYAMKCHIGEATLYRYLKRVKTEYENLG